MMERVARGNALLLENLSTSNPIASRPRVGRRLSFLTDPAIFDKFLAKICARVANYSRV